MQQDNLISQLTVRLKTKLENVDKVIGTGVIYYQQYLEDKVYVFTAAHCLFNDSETFKKPLESIQIDFYNIQEQNYIPLEVDNTIDKLLFKEVDKDVAIIVLAKDVVEQHIGQVPCVKAIKTRQSIEEFVIKGFPNATQGEELAVITPKWLQEMPVVPKFQLSLQSTYTEYNIRGFSGSGVFLKQDDDIYLLGIFTRFRKKEKGRVIYCQYLELINELLEDKHLPAIRFDYIGDNNLTSVFFQRHIESSIENLGPRFSEELNVKLPISQLFNDLVKDRSFKHRFIQVFDTWLSEYDRIPKEATNVQKEQKNLKEDILKWLDSKPWEVLNTVDIEWIPKCIEVIAKNIDTAISELYEKQEKILQQESKKEYEYNKPFDRDISNLRELDYQNNIFEQNLRSEVNIALSNYPVLILKGDAGSGKSHLLGDIASRRQRLGLPSILLLGQNFKATKTIQKNIIELLDLQCSFEEFLRSINSIGIQIGSRVPVFIDALNEGAGEQLWASEIAGFIKAFESYPYIGLVMSIRTTYYSSIIPEGLEKKVAQWTHQGFKGNEYAALKFFCKHYGLQQPDFPILAPEFTQPLFLILLCQGVKNSPTKKFPQGFQGIEKIFEYYLLALEKRFSKSREEYRLASGLIIDAIKRYSLHCYRQNKYVIPLNESSQFFCDQFPQYPHLLLDLIQEGVFIRNRKENYKTEKHEEVLHFAYERFGDYLIANNILDNYSSQEAVITAGIKEKELGKLMDKFRYSNRGIVEALAIALPERFNIELFEVYEWVYQIENENEKSYLGEVISDAIIDSIKWRKKESIDFEKLRIWFKSDNCYVKDETYLSSIVELATSKGHPFNSNLWHRIMLKQTMPDRDSLLQEYLRWNSDSDEEQDTPPLKRLIDWAWTPEISLRIDQETAILAAQLLAWVLSSTFRQLRDQTTKALVNLLVEQPDALIEVLRRFKDVDDMYILERLYAVAYGCILRTKQESAVQLIGTFVYEQIFKNGNPPEHILLRDYTQQTVAYMVHKNLGKNIDEKRFNPPYKSKLPKYPSAEDISQYYKEYEGSEWEKDKIRVFNQIHFSVMSSDFGRKKIEPTLRDFHPISFTQEKKYKRFLKTLSSNEIECLKQKSELQYQIQRAETTKTRFLDDPEKSQMFESFITEAPKHVQLLQDLSMELFPNNLDYVQNEIIPYLIQKKKIENKSAPFRDPLNCQTIKRHIVKKAFELGYDVEKHGHYDRQVMRSFSNRRQQIESIGKKYQWIAFHQILSLLADNHKIQNEYWNNKYFYYKSAHGLFIRDIDPVYITKNNPETTSDELQILNPPNEWWHKPSYNNWNEEHSSWIQNENDLPDVTKVIQKTDSFGSEWLFLDCSLNWERPKKLGIKKYEGEMKDLWYHVQGYIIKAKDKNKAIKILQDKNFISNWMPRPYDGHNDLFNREKYWSSGYLQKPHHVWKTVFYNHKSTKLKVVVSFESAKDQIDNDESGAKSHYNIPSHFLFEGLELKYGSFDGVLEDGQGKIIAQNIPNSGGLMIYKDVILAYLEKNNLDILWTLRGEKKVFRDPSSQNYFCELGGLFYFENQQLKGKINRFYRD